MKKLFIFNLVICSVICCSFKSVFSQELNKAKLDSLFDILSANDKAMGSLSIYRNGEQVYSRAIGFSYIKNGKPVPSHISTRYRIGSITKMFTATMVFQFIEEQKLSLETPLVNYFPDIPNSNRITIRNLLTHSTGIFDITRDSTYLEWMVKPKSKQEILNMLNVKLPLFPPGSKSEYSNSNYILLGYILESISQKSYSELLRERITSKIGIQNTYYGGKINTDNMESRSYGNSFGWFEHPDTDMSIPHGAGAIVSTSTDLTIFIDALFNGQLISKSSLDTMLTQKNGFGMGIFQFPFGEKKAYGHSGNIDAFTSNLAYFPDEKLAVAYLSNGQVYPINDIMIGVLSICFDKSYKLPNFITIDLPVEELKKYTGEYYIQDAPLTLRVFMENNKLFAQATNQNPFPLTAVGKDKFIFEQASIVLQFTLWNNELTWNQAGQLFLFKKKQ